MRCFLDINPLFAIAVTMILGIVSGTELFNDANIIILISFLLFSVSVALFTCKWPLMQTMSILLATYLISWAYAERCINQEIGYQSNSQQTYKAIVLSEPSVHGKVIQMDMAISSANKCPVIKASIFRDTIDNRWNTLHIGDGIEASSLITIRNYKLQTFIYYSDWKKTQVSLSALSSLQRLALKARIIRQNIVRLIRSFHLQGQDMAIVAAMTLGDKSGLSPDTKDYFSIAGASHVLALSGLHLGIIYAMLQLLILGGRRQWLKQSVILITIWGYALLVGLAPSVVRSALMLSIFSLVSLMNRNSLSVNSLSFAAIVMLTINPLMLFDIGFQLSFMSVFCLITFMPILPKGRIWSFITVPVIAQIGTAPLIAYYFHRFPCYFLLSNIIVIPAATIIIYSTMLLIATSMLPGVSILIAKTLGMIVNLLIGSLSFIASLPGASIEGLYPNKLQVAAIYLMVIAIYYIAATIINVLYNSRIGTKGLPMP